MVDNSAQHIPEARDRGETYRSVWRHMMQVPFKQDYIDVLGIRTRYVEAGDPKAPAVVLVHGTGGHWEAFCANIGPLAEHFHVFAFDMLGCGFSDKPDRPYEIAGYVEQTKAFMSAMGLQSAGFIGVSLGSWVVTRLALSNPELVNSMILISPPGLLPLPESIKARVDERRSSANDPSWNKISSLLEHLFYSKASLIDDIIAVRQQVYSLPGIDNIMPRMLTLFDPDIRKRNNLTEEQWRSIETPTLIIAHVDSPDLYLETARAIQKLLPNAQTVEMPRTAHWAQFEEPEAFNPIAIDFLSRNKG